MIISNGNRAVAPALGVIALLTAPLLCLSQTGIITTVAGNGPFGFFSGDGGPATSAGIGGPAGVAVDSAGNLYIADSLNKRIRKVDRKESSPRSPAAASASVAWAMAVPPPAPNS